MKCIVSFFVVCFLLASVSQLFAQVIEVPAEPRPVDTQALDRHVAQLEKRLAIQQAEIEHLTKVAEDQAKTIEHLEQHAERSSKLMAKMSEVLGAMERSNTVKGITKDLKAVGDNIRQHLPKQKSATEILKGYLPKKAEDDCPPGLDKTSPAPKIPEPPTQGDLDLTR